MGILQFLAGNSNSSVSSIDSTVSKTDNFYLTPNFLVEEAELQEMVKHTLSSRNSKSYRHLFDSCLGQTMEIKHDIIYDLDVDLPNKFFVKQEYVRKRIQKVFERHGAVQVAVPQLTPKGQSLMTGYEKSDTIVKVRRVF